MGFLGDWTSWAIKLGQEFHDWLGEQMDTYVFEPLWYQLPEGLQPAVESLIPYVSAANEWVPLEEAAILLGQFWIFQGTFIILKFVFKAIPTVG